MNGDLFWNNKYSPAFYYVCLSYSYEESIDTNAPCGAALGFYRNIGQGYIARCTCTGLVPDAAYSFIYVCYTYLS